MDDGIYQNQHESLRRFKILLCLIYSCWAILRYRAHIDRQVMIWPAERPSESNNKELGMMKSDRKGIAPLHV